MAFPRRLLLRRGDRRQEASWTPEAVASVEKVKKIINKKYQKRTIIGLETGRADAMSLTLSIVQKLTTNLEKMETCVGVLHDLYCHLRSASWRICPPVWLWTWMSVLSAQTAITNCLVTWSAAAVLTPTPTT